MVTPTLTSITPTTVAAGSAAFTLTATGTNFVPGSSILWDGTALPTTVTSTTQMTASITPSLIASSGSIAIRAMKPDTTTSGALTLTITGSGTGGGGGGTGTSFVLTGISPWTVNAGSASFTLTATGLGFVSGSTVTLNGTAATTTYTSATQLQCTVAAATVATAGAIAVGVTNPDNTTTNTLQLTAISQGTGLGPAPTLTSLSPNKTNALINPSSTTPSLTLTANGTNFVSGSVVSWNGQSLTTTYVSATQLTATVPATLLGAAGTEEIFVLNPDFTASNELPFTITVSPSQTPTLTSALNTTDGTNHSLAGISGITLNLVGTNFANGAVAIFGGTNLTTTYVSPTALTAVVPASLLTQVEELPVDVKNPSSATSNAVPYYVGMNIYFDEASDVVWDSTQNLLYVSKPTTSKANANTIEAFDPMHLTDASAAWIYQLPAGSNPGRLALSPDHKYLYVGLNYANEVQQLVLQGSKPPTLGNTISLGAYYAIDMQVSPVASASNTIAVVRASSSNATLTGIGGVVIYDGTVARTNIGIEYSNGSPTLVDTLQWSPDGSKIYASNNENYNADLYTLTVSSTGLAMAASGDQRGVFSFPDPFIHLDPGTGLIYGDDGVIANVSGGPGAATVNDFQVGQTGIMTPDSATNSAYFLAQPIADYETLAYYLQSFDMTTLNQTKQISLYQIDGVPQHMIRWNNSTTGIDGVAFATRKLSGCETTSQCSDQDGRLYVVFLPL